MIGHVDRVREELDGKRVKGTQAQLPLSEYRGRYWNSLGNCSVDVNVKQSDKGLLTMIVNGFVPEQVYALEYYHYDTFSWLMSYNKSSLREHVLFYPAEYFLVEFRASGGGGGSNRADEILWMGDVNFSGVPIIFTKDASQDDTGSNWATGMVLWLGGGLWMILILGVTMALGYMYFRRRQSGGYQRLHAEDVDL